MTALMTALAIITLAIIVPAIVTLFWIVRLVEERMDILSGSLDTTDQSLELMRQSLEIKRERLERLERRRQP